MKQSEIFLRFEGKAWLERNKDKIGNTDTVSIAIEARGIKPKSVLEIGCGDGWRLKKLKSKYGCVVKGIDPSAIGDGPMIKEGTATALPFIDEGFDVVIFGFSMYLIDRKDLFEVVKEADRVLQDGGYLIIHDFVTPDRPYARVYEHCEGVMSYHMNNSAMWLSHPWYELIDQLNYINPNSNSAYPDESVCVLRKEIATAFPVQP